MSAVPHFSRILITGAGGFLGRHLVEVLRECYTVFPFDVVVDENDPAAIAGSVTDLKAVRSALEGIQALVIAHMLPSRPGNYDRVEEPFEVNAKGVAILFQEAVTLGIPRVVLISSTSVVQGHLVMGRFLSGDLPPLPTSLYGLTKLIQEASAQFFHRMHGLEVAILRPALVALEEMMEDKYGVQRPTVNWQAIDPRDIAAAVCCALEAEEMGCEVFYLVGGPGAEGHADIAHAKARLGWEPKRRFAQFPRDGELVPAVKEHSPDFQPGYLLACCSIAVRNKPIAEALELIHAAGYGGIEILYSHIQECSKEELRQLAAHCASLGLKVPVISPYFSFTRGEKALCESLETAERVLEAASIFGTGKIRTFIDIGGDGLPSARAEESHWRSAREGLRKLCALAPGIEFVVETHESTLADTLPTVKRLLEEVATPNLRINFQANRDFLARGYLHCLSELYPWVSHQHWQQIRPDGTADYLEEEGLISFADVQRFLAEKNYSGTASVEYCWFGIEESRLRSGLDFLTRTARNADR